jgi:NAD(P)-dependent dehydrogenase (short-subunit alcohol dehydrogenase family)
VPSRTPGTETSSTFADAISLGGRHAVVTGGARGIGAETARELACLGATVSLLDIEPGGAERTAADFRGNDLSARGFDCDVASEQSVADAFAQATEEAGPIAILINNAGATSFVPFLETTEADWDKLIAVNLTGTFLCSRAAAVSMRAHGWGRIVNISSVAGKRGGGFLGRTPYSAAKAGVIGFTKALAREVASDGVTVNAIAPGPMDTDMTQILREDADLLERIVSQVPLRRRGLPHEVADAVCFLCSGLGSYLTGETINVDGGIAME